MCLSVRILHLCAHVLVCRNVLVLGCTVLLFLYRVPVSVVFPSLSTALHCATGPHVESFQSVLQRLQAIAPLAVWQVSWSGASGRVDSMMTKKEWHEQHMRVQHCRQAEVLFVSASD